MNLFLPRMSTCLIPCYCWENMSQRTSSFHLCASGACQPVRVAWCLSGTRHRGREASLEQCGRPCGTAVAGSCNRIIHRVLMSSVHSGRSCPQCHQAMSMQASGDRRQHSCKLESSRMEGLSFGFMVFRLWRAVPCFLLSKLCFSASRDTN